MSFHNIIYAFSGILGPVLYFIEVFLIFYLARQASVAELYMYYGFGVESQIQIREANPVACRGVISCPPG
jgi:tryptophan synthase alpha subunit